MAANSGADAIIIDLEDGVGAKAKETARIALATAYALPTKLPVIVRVNGRNTPWHSEDVACVASLPITGVMLPKVESADDIRAVRKSFEGRALFALIETARGLASVREVAQADVALRLAFGSIDYSTEIGCAHTHEALLAARSELVLASALGRLYAPIDGVTTILDDEPTVEMETRRAAELGFWGKLCIHPRQISAVRRGFMPSEIEVEWARQVLAVDREGVDAVGGAMVDAPVRARARQILSRISPMYQENNGV